MYSIKDISIGILIILVIVMLYTIWKTRMDDNLNKVTADILEDMIRNEQHNMREHIIAAHTARIRKLRKSRMSNIINGCGDGILRGALGGAITGGGAPVMLGGAIVWGVINGTMNGVNMMRKAQP